MLPVLLAAAAALPWPACSREDVPDKVFYDFRTGERVEGGVEEVAPPEKVLTPEDVAAQSRHMEESIAVMKQLQRALGGVTDLRSLEEARPRLEELAARMGHSLKFGESIEKLAPEVEAKYAVEREAASASLNETFLELQRNAELWAALQDVLQKPIQEASGKGR
jgi:hypothetical protein